MRRSLRIVENSLLLIALAAIAATPVAAQFNNKRPARPEVTLPEEPVRTVILRSCTACHGIDEYAYYAMDRDGWLALVDRMKVTPSGVVEGAIVADEDREILLDWLVSEFGPDSGAFPREYVPRELTESDFLSDGQAETLLAGSCQSCHSLDRIAAARFDEDQWRSVLVSEIGRGAPLLIDDAEPLIEWLGRTQGLNPAN